MWSFSPGFAGLGRTPLCMDGTLASTIVWARPGGSKPRLPQPKRRSREPHPWLSQQSIRDLVLFVGGVAGLYHQFVIAEQAQWILVVVAAAMAGVPLPLRLDEIRRNGSNGS